MWSDLSGPYWLYVVRRYHMYGGSGSRPPTKWSRKCPKSGRNRLGPLGWHDTGPCYAVVERARPLGVTMLTHGKNSRDTSWSINTPRPCRTKSPTTSFTLAVQSFEIKGSPYFLSEHARWQDHPTRYGSSLSAEML